MEKHPIPSMPRTRSNIIIRTSIYTFLKHYQYLTSISTTLALPFALSVLISQAFIPHSSTIFSTIYVHLHSLFEASSFPRGSSLIPFINLKLAQTISTYIFTFPFAISFLLLAKSSVISSLYKTKISSFPYISLYKPILLTHICNSFVIFSVNTTCFSLLFLAFTFLDSFQITSPTWVLFLSSIAAVFYSIVLANALVICNLALISSAMDEGYNGGFIAILRACVMIRGKTVVALGLTLPINLGLACIEALFHYRIITPWNDQNLSFDVRNKQFWIVGFEIILIAYLYSMIILLDVIVSCLFYQSCRMNNDFFHYKRNEEYCYDDDDGEKLKELRDLV